MGTASAQADSTGALHVARVGLIGDVHTEHVRLKGVLAHFATLELDCVLCTGDLPDGLYDAAAVDACCAMLQAAGVLTISGNHDRWIQDGELRDLDGATDRDELAPATLTYLAGLPPTREFATARGKALLCHGMGGDDMAGVQPFDRGYALESNTALQEILHASQYKFVLAGHTHRPMVRNIEAVGGIAPALRGGTTSLTIVNAGTLLTAHTPCCALVDFAGQYVQFYDVNEHGRVTPGEQQRL